MDQKCPFLALNFGHFFGGFPLKVDKEVKSQDKQSSAPCTYPLVKANVTK